jgi:nitrite reductase/ring-hydroxylating ferredoxin subunit
MPQDCKDACLPRRDVLHLLSAASVQLTLTAAALAETGPFLPLVEPLVVPLEKLKKPWAPVAFDTHFLDAEGRKLFAPGAALRVGDLGVHAFCLYCPHQMCFVEPPLFNTSPKIFFCPCHNSRFDTGGARVSGPTERGLFQFQTVLTAKNLTVTGIEAVLRDRLVLGVGAPP